jgi:hypothetical protein
LPYAATVRNGADLQVAPREVAVSLAKFSIGQIVSIGISAVVFILALKYVAKRFPRIPVVKPVADRL